MSPSCDRSCYRNPVPKGTFLLSYKGDILMEFRHLKMDDWTSGAFGLRSQAMRAYFDNTAARVKSAAKYLSLLVATFALNAVAESLPPPMDFSGSNVLARLSTASAKLSWSAPGMVCMEFQKAIWPGVRFVAGKAYETKDWSSAGGLALDLRNPGNEPLEVHVRVDDSEKADGHNHCRTGTATLAPGERVTLVMPFGAAVSGMKAGPPLTSDPAARVMIANRTEPFDSSHIVAFLIFLAKPEQPRSLELLGVRWQPKADLRGIVDRFGQYSRAEWPGKLHEEGELAQRRVEEERWLRANPPPADRDEFGGWSAGPQLKATGFFRTALVTEGREIPDASRSTLDAPRSARWWLVTPTGHLFWSVGSTCVRPEAGGPVRGREEMFACLPDGAEKAGYVDFYRLNLQRKYSEDWRAGWVAASCARLPAWGFTTIANWSDEATYRPHKVPFTATAHGGRLPFISAEEYKHAPGPAHRLPDFFSEKFPQLYEAAIAKATAEWRDDPWCIGYFVDNELAWDTWAQMGTGTDYLTAREAIAAPPALAGRQAFVKLLQAKYGTVEAFGKAWGVTVGSWDDPVRIKSSQFNEASRADCSAFMTALGERYFSVVSAAVKKCAPKQLYLGCRFAIRPKEVVAVAAKYCDVVSFNIYADTVDPEKWKSINDLGKPVVIGEFHFGATDRGMFHPGLRPTANQAERAKAYANYVRSAAAMPAMVGCHWFQYADEALTGRFDGENYNIGLVSVTDTPYPELRDAARAVNAQVYQLHNASR